MKALETKVLYGFRFWSLETKHDFVKTEKKVEELNDALVDIPASECARRNVLTYKRDVALVRLFEMLYNDNGHINSAKYRTLINGTMRLHLTELCDKCGRDYKEINMRFLPDRMEDDYCDTNK